MKANGVAVSLRADSVDVFLSYFVFRVIRCAVDVY